MLRGLFLDLSGVLYEGSQPLPGAVDAVRQLQQSSLQLRFVTNTSRKNRRQILADLSAMGFAIEPEQLFTAPSAAASWVREHKHHPFLLVHPDIRCEFDPPSGSEADVVVIGDAGNGLNYRQLDIAFRLLMEGTPLIAIGDNRYFKADGALHLDAGPFVRALEYAAGVEAIVTGKPSTAFFQQVLNDTGLHAGDVMMVGDDVLGDVDGALKAGLQACLVKTGKYRADDEKRITGKFSVHHSLADLVETLL
jgi:HAD superfamily hydrolase (TIGR01458 family)